MTKNPFLNALGAVFYIVTITLLLGLGASHKIGQNSLLAPLLMISMFTFSAAMMGYIFLYQPFVLYFDGHKKLAADLFIKTLAVFGAITILIFTAIFISTGQ